MRLHSELQITKRPRANSTSRSARRLAWSSVLSALLLAAIQPAYAQLAGDPHQPLTTSFKQTLMVAATEPVILEVHVPRGDLKILYSREGQVTITASARAADGTQLGDNYFRSVMHIDHNGNKLTIRQVPSPAYKDEELNVLYTIDVPYRTEVNSAVDRGNQTISGIMGPVRVVSGQGNINASYLSNALEAQVGKGDMDLNVIGAHVTATVGEGNISCLRAPAGIDAETQDGDIMLTIVGPSRATVKSGTGRVDVAGARASLTSSTTAGNLHIKGVPHDDWQLNSDSGNIHIELPPEADFELEASSNSGKLEFNREEITSPDTRHFQHKQNGGGKHVDVHSISGKIVIQ